MTLTNAVRALAFACALVPFAAQPASEDQKQMAYQAVDRNAEAIATVGDSIFFFAEPGMQEVESARFLKETLEGIGFRVQVGGAGMPTNVWAEWGSGKPKIVVVTEVDALPEGSQTPGSIARKPLVAGAPGHMEGHNTHAGVAVGAAHAIKQVMERYKLPGTVALSFGPAEEQLASRPFLVRAGLFKDADAAILIHIGDNLATGYGLMNYAAISAKFTFRGKTAHGAVNPWDGRDAVDAVELMSIGYDKLREHLRPSHRGHRTITMGGIQPNIIPDMGQIWWFVRDANAPFAKENFDKLIEVGKGAAMMTGTQMEMEVVASAWPQLANRAFAEAIYKNIMAVGNPKWTPAEEKFAVEFQNAMKVKPVGLAKEPVKLGARPQSFSSNDSGDVTWVVPTGSLAFPSSVPGISYHNWQAAVTPSMSIAHKGEVAGAKVLAATILDMLTEPDLLARGREEFLQATKTQQYFSLLPPEAKPQIDMNKEVMDKLRPEMRKHYLNKRATFR
jgi:aminobenzoyl-glutamate utilization protein B